MTSRVPSPILTKIDHLDTNRGRGWLDFERGAVVAILAVVALGTYSSDSNGAERGQALSRHLPLRGSLAQDAARPPSQMSDVGKVAVVMTPLDLKALSADAFDDGISDATHMPAGTVVR
ncbi:MAG: hypothetical protein ABL898_10985 [Hyphomicrobiaceae bacterium]|nr:hypothetical protein [Hyphomicrobiaceae bacterium]